MKKTGLPGMRATGLFDLVAVLPGSALGFLQRHRDMDIAAAAIDAE